MKARKGTRYRGARTAHDAEAPEADTGNTIDAGDRLMGDLPMELPGSFGARVERVNEIRHETLDRLGAVRREMNVTASQLKSSAAEMRRFLGRAEASRMADATSRRAEAAGMIGGLRRQHEARTQIWRGLSATMEKKRAGATR